MKESSLDDWHDAPYSKGAVPGVSSASGMSPGSFFAWIPKSTGMATPRERLADAILCGELKNCGTAKVERKGEGLGIATRAR